VVAANSLVTRSFPDYSVIAGNPARVVKQYDVQKKQWVLGSAAASAKVSSQSSSSEEEVLSAK
jgi:serine acetyltransferase